MSSNDGSGFTSYSSDDCVTDDFIQDADMEGDDPKEHKVGKVPEFVFPTNDLKIDLYDDYKNEDSIEAFDRAVARHENEGVNSLNIRWFTENKAKVEDESLLVHSWLKSAVKGNVKDMQLNFLGKPFTLPSLLHECRSLTVLYIDMHRQILKFPSSVGFVSLETLTLKDVKLVSPLVKVIRLSEKLKILRLEEVSGLEELVISGDSLLELSITKSSRVDDDVKFIRIACYSLQTLTIAWYFSAASEKRLEVCANELKTMHWRGDTVQYFLVSAPQPPFEEASFDFRPPLVKINEMMKKSLVRLIKDIDRVKRLELNCWHIEILTKDCRLGMLRNLTDLVINVWDFYEEHQISAIAYFLGLLPQLQNLSFKSIRQPWAIRIGKLMGLEKSMYANRVVKDMFSQLRSVEVELTGGHKELELANYLTKHAKNLEKMTILYSRLYTGRLEEINAAISKFERASLNVQIDVWELGRPPIIYTYTRRSTKSAH